MKNNKGTVLAITLGFVLVFIMVGLAAVYFSGAQNESIEKLIQDNQAFWLAEAGVQEAFFNLPTNLGPFNGSLSTGNYQAESVVVTPNVRWNINSNGSFITGSVVSKIRRIQVEVGPNVFDAVNTTGTLSSPGGGGLDDHISPAGSYQEGMTLVFQDIFGISEATMDSLKTVDLNNPKNNPPIPSGNQIIWVTGNLKITSTGWRHSGILVVNGNLNMEGGHFDGLIWVNGSVKMINGNDLTNGAIFINDPNDGDTKISGTSTIEFDTQEIDEAYALYSGSYPGSVHHMIHWQEMN